MRQSYPCFSVSSVAKTPAKPFCALKCVVCYAKKRGNRTKRDDKIVIREDHIVSDNKKKVIEVDNIVSDNNKKVIEEDNIVVRNNKIISRNNKIA